MARTTIRQTQADSALATDNEVQSSISSALGPVGQGIGLLSLSSSGVITVANGAVSIAPSQTGSLVKSVYQVMAPQSGTSIIPLNNNALTSSSGTSVWSKAFTLSSTQSIIQIYGTFMCDSSASGREIVVGVFRNSVCIGVSSVWVHSASRPMPMSFNFYDVPNTTSEITYSLRVGIHNTATWYVGGSATALFAGQLGNGCVTIEERK